MSETTPCPRHEQFVPSEFSASDPYHVLGISQSVDRKAVKAAFRKIALRIYPDRHQHPDVNQSMQEEFMRVRNAYKLLSNEKSRNEYHERIGFAARPVQYGNCDTTPQAQNSSPRHHLRNERVDADFSEEQEPLRQTAPLRTSTITAATDVQDNAEREEFIWLALRLFDEVKNNNTFSGIPTSALTPNGHSPFMEEQIRQRNEAFKNLMANHPSASRPVSPMVRQRSETDAVKSPIGKMYAIPAEQLNLEILNPTLEERRVDVVAVHGLGAIPNITWKEKTSGINWLSHEDMLPKAVPEARILRFGYDSLWMGETPIRTSLSTIAYKLLLSLNMMRVAELNRPLIFIGHCFGGLVIERALNLAKMRPEKYPGIFDSSVGVVFLGTPHRGSRSFTRESALLAAIAASSDLSQHLESELLNTMTSDTGTLLDVADDFITLCTDGGPMISCFFEQRSSLIGKVIGRADINEFIVDSTSATFDGHPKHGLEVDHFSLNKFNSPTNPHYVQVCAEVVRFYKIALTKSEDPDHNNLEIGFVSENTGNPSAQAAKPSASQLWNQLRCHQSSPTLSAPNSTRPRNRQWKSEAGVISTGASNISERMPLDQDVPEDLTKDPEEVVRKGAVKELWEEEERKVAALQEGEYQKRVTEEKQAAEQFFLDGLKKRMAKYGIVDPEIILKEHPVPRDEELSEQEVKDKRAWYLNHLKGVLIEEGMDGGQIDEILNDHGETMVLDGIETTVTRMAKKWVSRRLLDAYEIPWQYDENDRSTIIIKRWVPDYEQAFLWDHSQALRTDRGRKEHRDQNRLKANEEWPEDWPPYIHEKYTANTMQEMTPSEQAFIQYTRESSAKRQNSVIDEYKYGLDQKREKGRRKERRGSMAKSRSRSIPYRPTEVNLRDAKGKQGKSHKSSYLYSLAAFFGGAYLYGSWKKSRRNSAFVSLTSRSSLRRNASTDSARSAPDPEEVARRRRNSRTLSGDRGSRRGRSRRRASSVLSVSRLRFVPPRLYRNESYYR